MWLQLSALALSKIKPHRNSWFHSKYFVTVPDVIDGKIFTAAAVDLNPWVEYEFRVVASNKIGGGEPSLPSEKVRTEEAG